MGLLRAPRQTVRKGIRVMGPRGRGNCLFWVASDLPLEAFEQGLYESQFKRSVSALSGNEVKELADPEASDVCRGHVRHVRQKPSWPSPTFLDVYIWQKEGRKFLLNYEMLKVSQSVHLEQ